MPRLTCLKASRTWSRPRYARRFSNPIAPLQARRYATSPTSSGASGPSSPGSGFIDESETDVLAHMDFPVQHRAKLHSTNPLE